MCFIFYICGIYRLSFLIIINGQMQFDCRHKWTLFGTSAVREWVKSRWVYRQNGVESKFVKVLRRRTTVIHEEFRLRPGNYGFDMAELTLNVISFSFDTDDAIWLALFLANKCMFRRRLVPVSHTDVGCASVSVPKYQISYWPPLGVSCFRCGHGHYGIWIL